MTKKGDGYTEIRSDVYYKQMNYEAALTSQENRIAMAVSSRDKPGIIWGITALAHMLPKERRKKTMDYIKKNKIEYSNATNDGIDKWMMVWDFCNDQLQDANLIFREGKGPSEFGNL